MLELALWIGIPLLWILSGMLSFRWYNLATGNKPEDEFVWIMGPIVLPILPLVAVVCGVAYVVSRDKLGIPTAIKTFMLPLEYDKNEYSSLGQDLRKRESEARTFASNAKSDTERQIFVEAANRYGELGREARNRGGWYSGNTERVKKFKKKNNLT
ncbi:hypothetical protein SEA_GODONK_47 [Gordonia phage GodonK]|uniref:Uncharacterized protein n=1 Tax=Gordonia phage GodonK TaxID=2562192 RepID=A0A4D6E221_9CAUD|nr:hypothetical protein HOV33_gp047 [Gordonia phage GodonK]QBZ72666.1 hypothetical protein SEA_GODONK_47 [Gordonia phage GodonK]